MVQSVGANLSPDQTFGSIRSLSVTREVASFPLSRTPTPPPQHRPSLLGNNEDLVGVGSPLREASPRPEVRVVAPAHRPQSGLVGQPILTNSNNNNNNNNNNSSNNSNSNSNNNNSLTSSLASNNVASPTTLTTTTTTTASTTTSTSTSTSTSTTTNRKSVSILLPEHSSG